MLRENKLNCSSDEVNNTDDCSHFGVERGEQLKDVTFDRVEKYSQ